MAEKITSPLNYVNRPEQLIQGPLVVMFVCL